MVDPVADVEPGDVIRPPAPDRRRRPRTRHAPVRSPTTLVGSNSIPQASNSFFRSEWVSVGRHAGRRGRCRQRLAPGIDHRHQLAAAHHELVDRVQCRGRQVLRLGHQQHLDVRVDHLRVGRHGFHRVGLPQQHRRGVGLPAGPRPWRHHHRPRIAVQRQRRHHADHRPFRVRQFVDQLGQVVFQEPLALGLEERDGPLVVLQIGPGQAEIDLRARPDPAARLAGRRPWRGPRCR